MKLELTVTAKDAERFQQPMNTTREVRMEPKTIIAVTAEGDPALVAGHLRAVADALDPKPNSGIPIPWKGDPEL